MDNTSSKYQRLESTKEGEATQAEAQIIDSNPLDALFKVIFSKGTISSKDTLTPAKDQVIDNEASDTHSIEMTPSTSLPAYEDAVVASKCAIDKAIEEAKRCEAPEDLLVYVLSAELRLRDKLDILGNTSNLLWRLPMERYKKMGRKLEDAGFNEVAI